jgi:hypothetical protein
VTPVSLRPTPARVASIGGASGSAAATRASDFPGAGDAFKAIVALAVEDALADEAGRDARAVLVVEAPFAAEAEAGAAESEAEVGADDGEDTPWRSAARADGPNNANSMAATATLTSLPLT